VCVPPHHVQFRVVINVHPTVLGGSLGIRTHCECVLRLDAQMIPVFRRTIMAWYLFSFSLITDLALADEMERFLREAPPAWTELNRLEQSIQCTVTENVDNHETGMKSEIIYSFNANQGSFRGKYVMLSGDLDADETIRCTNSRYSFRLRRTKAADPFDIRTIEPIVGGALGAKSLIRTIEKYRVGSVWRMLYTRPIDSLLRDQLLKISAATDADGLVRLTFLVDDARGDGPRVISGTATLDPSLNWVIRECELVVAFADGNAIIRASTQFNSLVFEKAFPSHHVCEVLDEISKKVLLRQDFEFSEVKPGDVAESECRLSAFGLPEPTNLERSSGSRLAFILIINGSILLILAVVLKKRFRRSPEKG